MKGATLSIRARWLAAGLTAALAFTAVAPVAAQQVTIVIGGQPVELSPGPIERSGRVFVPLRGVFERLGASVVYNAGEINATRGRTTVSLHIGSTQATVDGQQQYVDVAPFIVGASTYVPLRFIAQSLGAVVNYNDSTRVVAISMRGPAPMPPAPPPVPPPAPVPVVRLVSANPGEGAYIVDRFSVISAQFSPRVQPDTVRILLDGNNITSRSGVSGSSFSYKPPAPLDVGPHTVRVTGVANNGVRFERSWTFTVRGSSPNVHLTINQPGDSTVVGPNFVIRGNTVPNGRIRVTAGATPAVTGEFDGSADAGPRGNFIVRVALATMPGQQSVRVRIVAIDPVSSQRTETTLQLRLK